jgi:hypothetical protein
MPVRLRSRGHRRRWIGRRTAHDRFGAHGGSARPGSRRRKPALVGCSVVDRAGGGKLTGAPEELPRLSDGAGDDEEVLWGGLPVACSAYQWCAVAARRVEQRSRTKRGV